MIETPRLQLIPCELPHLEAFLHGPEALAGLVGATVPEGFPVFREGFHYAHERLRADASVGGWLSYLFVARDGRVIIGDGGFKGPPDTAGVVEIGYAIVPEQRRRGYASEAARGLTARAFADPRVAAVAGETLADGAISMRVLAGLRMRRIATRHDPEEGEIVRWLVRREEFAP